MVVIWGLLFALPTTAQQATPPGAQAQQRTPPGVTQVTSSSNASTSAGAKAPPTTVSDADQETIKELTHRIQKLELGIIEKSRTSSGDIAIIVAFIALFGQLLIVWREDRRAGRAAEKAVELAKQEARFQQTERTVEFRLKQLQQFYAPMRALLRQSEGLYNQMRHRLAQDQSDQYRWAQTPDPKDGKFEVRAKDGTWKGFRLLDQLPAVRGNPYAFALVEGILQTGEKMTRIISEHAGLASEDLNEMLGEYMAHYAALSAIYRLGETEPYEPGWHKTGYYTRDLNGKVEGGYRELTQFINKYAKEGESMLETVPAGKDVQQSLASSHPS